MIEVLSKDLEFLQTFRVLDRLAFGRLLPAGLKKGRVKCMDSILSKFGIPYHSNEINLGIPYKFLLENLGIPTFFLNCCQQKSVTTKSTSSSPVVAKSAPSRSNHRDITPTNHLTSSAVSTPTASATATLFTLKTSVKMRRHFSFPSA